MRVIIALIFLSSWALAETLDLQTYLKKENDRLASYGWVDKDAGIAHIPIDKAIDLFLQKINSGEFAREMASGQPQQVLGKMTPSEKGKLHFTTKGCVACHNTAATSIGPNLEGVFNTPQLLTDGTSPIADEAYIKESILDPNAKIVKGYQPIMTSYKTLLTDEELTQLVEYIKSLATPK